MRRPAMEFVDAVALLALASIVVGVGARFGWDIAAIVLGITVLLYILLPDRTPGASP